MRCPYGASAQAAIESQYDLYYIKNRPLILDAIINFCSKPSVSSSSLERLDAPLIRHSSIWSA